jgi:hypothetical protein
LVRPVQWVDVEARNIGLSKGSVLLRDLPLPGNFLESHGPVTGRKSEWEGLGFSTGAASGVKNETQAEIRLKV